MESNIIIKKSKRPLSKNKKKKDNTSVYFKLRLDKKQIIKYEFKLKYFGQ